MVPAGSPGVIRPLPPLGRLSPFESTLGFPGEGPRRPNNGERPASDLRVRVQKVVNSRYEGFYNLFLDWLISVSVVETLEAFRALAAMRS